MIGITAELSGETVARAMLLTVFKETEDKAKGAVARTAARGKDAVQSYIAVDTGNIQGSVGYQLSGGAEGPYARIGTGEPYGRRLELDFYGTDSLGRRFNHTSLPHPAFSLVAPMLIGWFMEEMR